MSIHKAKNNSVVFCLEFSCNRCEFVSRTYGFVKFWLSISFRRFTKHRNSATLISCLRNYTEIKKKKKIFCRHGIPHIISMCLFISQFQVRSGNVICKWFSAWRWKTISVNYILFWRMEQNILERVFIYIIT